jgi:hypothetical protein
MTARNLRLMSYGLLGCCLAISSGLLGREVRPVDAGLTAHEWGTFTSIAGERGQAVLWTPLSGATDLPGFVEHFRDPHFKLGLQGTVRMETPVLYFYDSRETTVSVKVNFSNGVITEWYPHANRVEPQTERIGEVLYNKRLDGSIAWDAVTVAPNVRADFPDERRDSHYYAARQTSATPLRVMTASGEQREKFLFYRGVATFAVPVSARVAADGNVTVENHGGEKIPNVVLFERRGEKVGFRIGGAVENKTTLEPAALTEDITSLSKELEGVLISQGLYQDEAQAMVATWRNSWFEEGSRLLYIVPGAFVDRVLPLTISPAPAQTVRVFVGRMELVTPATERAVERALASKDQVTLAKYGRFLEPILQTMMKKERNRVKLQQIQQELSTVYSAVVAQNVGSR